MTIHPAQAAVPFLQQVHRSFARSFPLSDSGAKAGSRAPGSLESDVSLVGRERSDEKLGLEPVDGESVVLLVGNEGGDRVDESVLILSGHPSPNDVVRGRDPSRRRKKFIVALEASD